MRLRLTSTLIFALLLPTVAAKTPDSLAVHYTAEMISTVSSADFAPYYIVSNRFGIATDASSALARVAAHAHVTNGPWRLRFGVDLIGGLRSGVDYQRFLAEADRMTSRKLTPPEGNIQQLYARADLHAIFIELGMRHTGSAMLDDRLSSGDMTWSANARPTPGVRLGLNRFVDIPLTRGAILFNGEFFYGHPTDKKWLESHYNRYNSFVTTGCWINYKRFYFRTKESLPLSVTVGMQAAAQFAGTQRTYEKGVLKSVKRERLVMRDFLDMLFPQGGDNYYRGNHLGSWDLMARYRLHSGHTLKAYWQWPWEDGSGIGKLNGWDGLWGIEYKAPGKAIVDGAVVEYITTLNQSGPIHWDPSDITGTTVTAEATGSDSYYNNYFYNGYAVYGMSIGTPMLKSPIYNTDGYLHFTDTRIRGFHMAVSGTPMRYIDYRAMFSWRESFGDSYIPRLEKARATSCMLEVGYSTPFCKGMRIRGQIALDRGDLYGNNLGGCITISYSGRFK